MGEKVKGVAAAPEKYLETGMHPEKTNFPGLSDNTWLTKQQLFYKMMFSLDSLSITYQVMCLLCQKGGSVADLLGAGFHREGKMYL